MAVEIKMPSLTDTMEAGTILRWHVREGDKVVSGQVIAEVETDKATMELESYENGVLLKILVPEGKETPIQSSIAIVGKAGENVDSVLAVIRDRTAKVPPAPKPEKKVGEPQPTVPLPAHIPTADRPRVEEVPAGKGTDERIKASPVAVKMAVARGIDLSRVVPSGPGGRIVKRDIETFLIQPGSVPIQPPRTEPPSVPGGTTRTPLTGIRKTIARRMAESKRTIPEFSLKVTADMEPLVRMREEMNGKRKKSGLPEISLNAILIKSISGSLSRFPMLNSHFLPEEEILTFADHNISFAVQTERGLYTPVIFGVQNMGLLRIQEKYQERIEQARNQKLTLADFSNGTFTLTSLGTFGVEEFTAIINPPQVAALAVGTLRTAPWATEEGQVIAKKQMTLTLMCDHRVVDGVLGAGFLADLKESLQNPLMVLL